MEIISSLYINPGLKKKNFLSYHTTWKQYLQFWFIYLTLTMGKTKNSIWQPITILWTLSKQNQIQTINKLLCGCLVNGPGRMSFSTMDTGFLLHWFGIFPTIWTRFFFYNHLYDTIKRSWCMKMVGYMCGLVTKSTKWHVHPAKTQISLGIRPVWSVFAVRMKKAWVLSYPLSAQWRPWSDWADAGRTCHFVGFVMRWLIFSCFIRFAFVCSEIKD